MSSLKIEKSNNPINVELVLSPFVFAFVLY